MVAIDTVSGVLVLGNAPEALRIAVPVAGGASHFKKMCLISLCACVQELLNAMVIVFHTNVEVPEAKGFRERVNVYGS